ncbi:hypothetical protein [Porphyromonas levii]|uniref:Lipoprotein n=1 Tax=Porphyromonas levii TaxID=28114 RepID=A0A4Y8WPU2_9PORP|nr:hypothetical protein [Porphyromonas levii]TFH94459.1 hypothetical protein E4P47_07380 [Porphyromonas levii]TFH95364.1 hypothetical protein E4P48_08105 [Porphyromonas levii]
MKKKRFKRNLLTIGALGVLSLTGCKTAQKTKTPPPERPVLPEQDSIRPPYGEIILMYGTPYREYETKDAVPHEPTTTPKPDK